MLLLRGMGWSLGCWGGSVNAAFEGWFWTVSGGAFGCWGGLGVVMQGVHGSVVNVLLCGGRGGLGGGKCGWNDGIFSFCHFESLL